MRRGTSPTLKLTTDQDWTGYEVVVTIEEDSAANGNVELNLEGDRLTIANSTIYVTLTQEETLKFRKKAKVQIKGKKGYNVIATDISNIPVLPILNEEVM